MKKILLGLMLLAAQTQASPYFRFYGWDNQAHSLSAEALSHPQPVAGALIDPKDLGQTRTAALLPIITHSPNDGCLFPSIVCEDWTPLAVGASINAGKATFDAAALFNIFPWMVSGAKVVAPAKFQPLINSAPSAVTFSAGPVWEYRQSDNKGYFFVFTGVALHF